MSKILNQNNLVFFYNMLYISAGDLVYKMESEEKETLLYHTTAQLKGRRLRMVRALTGFSRQELYEKIGIATSTMDTWESGRIELTEKSAGRICESLRKVGILCDVQWLLSGTGIPPRAMDDIEKSIFSSNDKDGTKILDALAQNGSRALPIFMDEDMRRELNFFLSLHKNALFHLITDNSELPYKKFDCVAGIEEDISRLIGKRVIAYLQSGESILCKMIGCNKNKCNVSIKKSIQHNIIIESAARIIWHRKPFSKKCSI